MTTQRKVADARTLIKYPGSKWTYADWIVSHIPEHKVYLEPFFGSGAVFFNKQPAPLETINDIDDNVVNFFRVVRDHPEELERCMSLTPYARREFECAQEDSARAPLPTTGDPIENARRFAVRCSMGFGNKTCQRVGWKNTKSSGGPINPQTWQNMSNNVIRISRRLLSVQIECRPASELIEKYNAPDCLIYADPPYLFSLRTTQLYRHEMGGIDEHVQLLELLKKHKGPVILSGYDSPLYNESLKDWFKSTREGYTNSSHKAIETIWMNFEPYTQMTLTGGVFVLTLDNRILRVFPSRTSYTPDDGMVWIGSPYCQTEIDFATLTTKEIPAHDEVHISCSFSWDKKKCEILRNEWEIATGRECKLGGPAYGGDADDFEEDRQIRDFTPGLYVKHGITFTSRGCDNACPWCGVSTTEGPLRELNIIHPGNIIQDNNFLQTSRKHRERVYDMLSAQRGVCFRGGLEVSYINYHFIYNIQRLAIAELWVACDTPNAVGTVTQKIKMLNSAGFNRNKIMCYVLIGDDMEENEERCRAIYNAGAMPRAQLRRDFGDIKTVYSYEWKRFESMWQRPAATVSHMEKGTDWRNYSK